MVETKSTAAFDRFDPTRVADIFALPQPRFREDEPESNDASSAEDTERGQL